jgi:hypothetical protein
LLRINSVCLFLLEKVFCSKIEFLLIFELVNFLSSQKSIFTGASTF